MNRKQMKAAAARGRRLRFLEQFRQPEYSDDISFVIEREDRKGRYFSQEYLEEINDQMETFIGARMLAAGERMGQPPSKMTIHLSLEFE